MHDGLTLDQVETFIEVVEAGGFAAAARRNNRSPATITYVIQKLEAQLGTTLFDRSGYRPNLTEAGLMLLPRARRVAAEMGGLRVAAKGLAKGLETELTLVVDSMVPTASITQVLAAFQVHFPTVSVRLFIETFGTATQMVVDGTADLGISYVPPDLEGVHAEPFITVATALITGKSHPLATFARVTVDDLRHHCQIIVTDRTSPRMEPDFSVYSPTSWRVGDMQTKLTLLEQSFGFGTMPIHLAKDGLTAGRLVVLECDDVRPPPFQVPLVHRADRSMGPATRWMYSELRAAADLREITAHRY